MAGSWAPAAPVPQGTVLPPAPSGPAGPLGPVSPVAYGPSPAPGPSGPLAPVGRSPGSLPPPRIPSLPVHPADDAHRTADGRIARLHLRGGMLAIARAALEQMAGAGSLDTEALVDLAEVRWRSGDLEGAAEAARAHQSFGGQEPLADLILAEILMRRGRPQDAHRHAQAVQRRVGGAVELLFAGERRGPGWPAPDEGWLDAGASQVGRFGLLVGGREVAAPTPDTWPPAVVAAPAGAMAAPSGVADDAPAPELAPLAATRQPRTSPSAGRAAGRELEAVEALFSEGRFQAGAERLSVLLRVDGALAPVILSMAGAAITTGGAGAEGLAALYVLRGDAYRAMGRQTEAEAAYQQAVRALPARPAAKEST